MNFSSKLIEQSVEAFASLPGIGRKTALRLTLHLVGKSSETSEQFAEAIVQMRRRIQHCTIDEFCALVSRTFASTPEARP